MRYLQVGLTDLPVIVKQDVYVYRAVEVRGLRAEG
jgi:hypothetical protein